VFEPVADDLEVQSRLTQICGRRENVKTTQVNRVSTHSMLAETKLEIKPDKKNETNHEAQNRPQNEQEETTDYCLHQVHVEMLVAQGANPDGRMSAGDFMVRDDSRAQMTCLHSNVFNYNIEHDPSLHKVEDVDLPNSQASDTSVIVLSSSLSGSQPLPSRDRAIHSRETSLDIELSLNLCTPENVRSTQAPVQHRTLKNTTKNTSTDSDQDGTEEGAEEEDEEGAEEEDEEEEDAEGEENDAGDVEGGENVAGDVEGGENVAGDVEGEEDDAGDVEGGEKNAVNEDDEEGWCGSPLIGGDLDDYYEYNQSPSISLNSSPLTPRVRVNPSILSSTSLISFSSTPEISSSAATTNYPLLSSSSSLSSYSTSSSSSLLSTASSTSSLTSTSTSSKSSAAIKSKSSTKTSAPTKNTASGKAPDIENASTPQLQRLMQSYGLKPKKKKQMREKLQKLWRQMYGEVEHERSETLVAGAAAVASSMKTPSTSTVNPVVGAGKAKRELKSDELKTDLSMEERVREFIFAHDELYLKVVMLEGVNFKDIQNTLKASGIACTKSLLLGFLDREGIAVSMKDTQTRVRGKFGRSHFAKKKK
jgi:hypothetical protein